jgi:Na+-driven multidrug efflux pump
MAPLWNAFTEAFILKEFDWINKTIGKLKSVSFLLSFVVVMMVLVSQPVFRFWVSSISIPVMITVAVAITTIINIWNGLYSQFLNGTGKVMLQLYFGIFSAILNIPLSYFLGKYFGVSGVILSTAIVSLPGLILYPLQFKKIMSGNLNGIWNK